MYCMYHGETIKIYSESVLASQTKRHFKVWLVRSYVLFRICHASLAVNDD